MLLYVLSSPSSFGLYTSLFAMINASFLLPHTACLPPTPLCIDVVVQQYVRCYTRERASKEAVNQCFGQVNRMSTSHAYITCLSRPVCSRVQNTRPS